MTTKSLIKCPHCKCEYLPAEIFYPKSFLGYPTNIFKDENGAILGYNGDDMNTSETFCCDKCGKDFIVEASITFKTSPFSNMFEDEDEFKVLTSRKK